MQFFVLFLLFHKGDEGDIGYPGDVGIRGERGFDGIIGVEGPEGMFTLECRARSFCSFASLRLSTNPRISLTTIKVKWD